MEFLIHKLNKDNFYTASLTTAVILEPGESLTSDRILRECGAFVIASLHYVYDKIRQFGGDPPGHLRHMWDEYRAMVEKTPPSHLHLRIHLEVHGVVHRLTQHLADDGRAVPAHQDGGALVHGVGVPLSMRNDVYTYGMSQLGAVKLNVQAKVVIETYNVEDPTGQMLRTRTDTPSNTYTLTLVVPRDLK